MQPLEAGEPAPTNGVLVPLDLAAELVVGASVAKSLSDIELRVQDEKHAAALDASRKLILVEQDARAKQQQVYQAALDQQNAWHRAPLLWYGLGVVSSILIGGLVLAAQ